MPCSQVYIVLKQLMMLSTYRANFQAGELIITREGILLGSNWLKTQARDKTNLHEGLLERKKEIELTQHKIKQLEECRYAAREFIRKWATTTQKKKRQQQSQLQLRLNELHREESQIQSVIYANENRIKQTESNQQRVLAEIIELELQQTNGQESHQGATKLRNKALSLLDSLETEKSELKDNDGVLLEGVSTYKEQTSQIHEVVQQTQLKVETFKATQTSAKQQLDRLDERLKLLEERKQGLIEQNNKAENDSTARY